MSLDDVGRCTNPGRTGPGVWVPRPERITDDLPSPWFEAYPSDTDRYCDCHGPGSVVPRPSQVTRRWAKRDGSDGRGT